MKLSEVTIGSEILGRVVMAINGSFVDVRCACGTVSHLSIRSAEQNGRCRACGYANMKPHRREAAFGDPTEHSRMDICRAVVAEMGTVRDDESERTLERDPVVAEVLRRFADARLGSVPMSLAEVSVLLGVSKERVRKIEEQAMATMRSRFESAPDLIDELRHRDATRGCSLLELMSETAGDW